MAKKQVLNADEKFEQQDFDLFVALAELDKKNYNYLNSLTVEQQRKFIPYMMTHWMSTVKGNSELQNYYLRSIDYHANKNLFNETIQKHPLLQWLMLCAASPGIGKQYHQYIPHLTPKVINLKEPAKIKDIRDYYAKVYPKANKEDIEELSKVFVEEHNKKCYLASKFPNLKISDIDVLSKLVTDEEIKQYEKEQGN